MFFRKHKNDDLKNAKIRDDELKALNNNEEEYYLEDKFPEDFKKTMELIKEIKESVISYQSDIIKELKAEIAALKAERREDMRFIRDTLTKLIDKPTAPPPPSPADRLLALRAANNSGGSGLAAIDKAAKKS